MTANRVFHAKVLLFGEYSLLAGSRALTVPFRQFSGRLTFMHPISQPSINPDISNSLLKDLLNYLSSQPFYPANIPAGNVNSFSDMLDLGAMDHDIQHGLYFDSNIPNGYGVGSSGALVAAIYDRYKKGNGTTGSGDALLYLKAFFGAVESYFHGTSSGIDPLSCYLATPLLLEGSGVLRTVEIKLGGKDHLGGFFLTDTGQTGLTAPLVKLFKEKQKQEDFAGFLHQHYVPAVNGSIAAILANRTDELPDWLHMLSDYQFRYFREMIPPGFLSLWEKGVQTGAYSLKLCGSGGGGYLLGYTSDYQNVGEAIAPPQMTLLPLAF